MFFFGISLILYHCRRQYSRDILDGHLSRALNVQLTNNRIVAIDDSKYVLTLDYTYKMLNINERRECGFPVIIEGETGVGKTALIQMLSKLWKQYYEFECKRLKERIFEHLKHICNKSEKNKEIMNIPEVSMFQFV